MWARPSGVPGIFCASCFNLLHPPLCPRRLTNTVYVRGSLASPALVLLIAANAECWQEIEGREKSKVRVFVPLTPFLQRGQIGGCGMPTCLKQPPLSLGSGNSFLVLGGDKQEPCFSLRVISFVISPHPAHIFVNILFIKLSSSYPLWMSYFLPEGDWHRWFKNEFIERWVKGVWQGD